MTGFRARDVAPHSSAALRRATTLPRAAVAVLSLCLAIGAGSAPAQEALPTSFHTKFRRDRHGWAARNKATGFLILQPKLWQAAYGACDGMVLTALAAYDPLHPDAPGLYSVTTKMTVVNRQYYAASAQSLAASSGLAVTSQSTKPADAVASVIQSLVQTNTPQIFRLNEQGKWGGHSVLATGFERRGDKIVFSVYDPNHRYNPNPAIRRDVFLEYDASQGTYRVFTRDSQGKTESIYTYNLLKHAPAPLLKEVLEKARDMYRDAADHRFDGQVTSTVHGDVIVNSDPTVGSVVIQLPGPLPDSALAEAEPGDGNAKGVRIQFDERLLAEVLNEGTAEENAELLEQLGQSLARADGGGARDAALAAFETQVKLRFRGRRELNRLDNLAVVSLKSLVEQAELHAGDWNSLPDDLRHPGGITRLHGFVVSGDDILILGRREAGAPVLDIDDLVVGIRASWQENATPLVSLDPDPADLEGDPKIRIQGVPADSEFALIMLEADYAMKRIMAGVEPVGADGYRTLVEILGDSSRSFMSRFWLYPIQPGAGDIQVASDASSAVFAGGVQVLSEEMLQLKGGLVGTGSTYVPAEEAACSFTEHYEAIAAELPVFRSLQTLFDVVLLGRLWRVGGVQSPLLDRLCALPHRAVAIPQTYRAVHVTLRQDGDGEYYLHGGVQAKIGAGERSWLALDDEGLTALRDRCGQVSAAGEVSGSLAELSLAAATPSTRRDASSRDFTTAVTALFGGDLDAALAAADRLVAADPWDGDALAVRALIQLRCADYVRARRDAERARSVDPGNRELASAAAEILFQCRWMEGDPDGALREIDASLQQDSPNANTQVARAEALWLLDKPDEARTALVKAVELDPASAIACARLAMLELGENRTLAAKPWVARARALDPELPEVLIAAAQWELATIRPDLAEKIAREVWEKEANGPTVRLQALAILAAVSAAREKWTDVDNYVGRMDKLSAGSPEVLLVAAEIAATWGERQRARAYLAKAETLSPQHPLVIKLRAKIVK